MACPVVHAGQTLGTNRLVAELWPDAGTDGAARTVLTYVSQLRKRPRGRPASLDTWPGGYVLDVDLAGRGGVPLRARNHRAGGELDPARRLAAQDGPLTRGEAHH